MKLTLRQQEAINQIIQEEVRGITKSRDSRHETLRRSKRNEMIVEGLDPMRRLVAEAIQTRNPGDPLFTPPGLHEKFGAFDVKDRNVLGGEYGEEETMLPHNFENAAKEQFVMLLEPVSELFVDSHLDLVDGMGPGAREEYSDDLMQLAVEMQQELLSVIQSYSAKFTEKL